MSTQDATNPGPADDLSANTGGVATDANTDSQTGQGEDDLILPDDEAGGDAAGGEGEGEGAGQPEGTGDDETEEFEHDGVKYAVPKALVPALMKDGDYTQKTQELGTQRRQVEEREKATTAQAREIELDREVLQESAKLITVDTRVTQIRDAIAAYDQVDWAAVAANDRAALAAGKPEEANRLGEAQAELHQLRRMLELAQTDQTSIKDAIAQKKDELAKAGAERTTAQNALVAEERKACAAACQREIPNWEKRQPLIKEFAIKHGLSEAEWEGTRDPRVFKILDMAFDGARAKEARKTQQRVAPALGGAAPVKRVVPNGAPPATDPNRMSTEAWMKHRRGQLSKKGGR